MKSEDLFQGQKRQSGKVNQFLGMNTLTDDMIVSHYKTPINEKSDRIIFRTDIDTQLEKMKSCLLQLRKNGVLT